MQTVFKKYLVILIVLLTGMGSSVFAQIVDPVKWQSSVNILANNEAELQFTANIEQGWYMYAIDIPAGGPIPTSFDFEPDAAYELIGSIREATAPTVKMDPAFNMRVGLFKNTAVFLQKIKILKNDDFEVKAAVTYASCDENSCLPPKQVDIPVKVSPGKGTIATLSPAPGGLNLALPDTITEEAPPIVEEDIESSGYEGMPLWLFFLIALSSGFLGALTPCVYPMIPLTVSFFMRDEQKRSQGIVKALIFGLSIILVYTSVGVIVALTKKVDITNMITGHWLTNLIFAVLFIVFALSFFGLFDITMPSSLTNKIDRKADKGGYIAAFFMALALVVISFSCTGLFVGEILVLSTQGLAIKPIIGMFGFGLAFALPFIFLAFFPSLLKKMPKSGGWMNAIKVVCAFIMLAFALYFLSYADKSLEWNLISRDIYICIWMVLFALTGYYLLGKIRFAHDSELPYISIPRLFFAIICFTFVVYLFTGLLGRPLSAISGLLPVADHQGIGMTQQQSHQYASGGQLCGTPKYSDHNNLNWPWGLQGYFDYDEAISCAKEKHLPVLLIFKGHTCAKCREMESAIWSDPEILDLMSNRFVLLALYTDDISPLPESEYIKADDGKVKKTLGEKNLAFQISRYHINSMPYHVILDANGKTLVNPMGYTGRTKEFRDFLLAGLQAFK